MFKCEVTGRTTKPGEKMVRIVVETREKEYLDENENFLGHGFETVRELSCSAEGATLWPTLHPMKQLQILGGVQ